MDKELEEKIKNRTTELQSAYDMAIEEKTQLDTEIMALNEKRSLAIKRIEACEARADELNMSHVL